MWIISIDLTIISPRFLSVTLKSSKSEPRPPGPIPMMKRPAGAMIEHGAVAGDLGRVVLRQVQHAGAELDRLRDGDQRRHELQRVWDRLGRGAVVLADPGLVVAELLGQQDGFAVLLQDVQVVAPRVVQRHHEQAKLHCPGSPGNSLPASRPAAGHHRPYRSSMPTVTRSPGPLPAVVGARAISRGCR